jgi:hypothetical protein
VSAFQKVATFRIVGGVQKQGGNVASYFCTPEGRVLHAIAGPVDANRFLREARWANDTYQHAQIANPSPEQLQRFMRNAHLERLEREHGVPLPAHRLPPASAVNAKVLDQLLAQNHRLGLSNEGNVHLLLAVGAMPRLDHVYAPLFERVLLEKISTVPVAGR